MYSHSAVGSWSQVAAYEAQHAAWAVLWDGSKWYPGSVADQQSTTNPALASADLRLE